MCDTGESLSLIRSVRYVLHDACEGGNIDNVLLLLNAPVPSFEMADSETAPIMDVNARDHLGATPLHVALVARAPTEIVNALLSAGARPGLRVAGSPALHVSLAVAAHAGILHETRAASARANFEALLSSGTDIMATDDMGRTPLHLAATGGVAWAVNLITKRAETRAREKISSAAASTDAGAADTAAAAAKHACLFALDKLGETSLHLSAAGGHTEITSTLLILAPGLADIADRVGERAAHAAARAGHHVLFNILSAAMVDKDSLSILGLRACDVLANVAPPSSPPTLLISHVECDSHRTCAPLSRDVTAIPPENTARLAVLLDDTRCGTLTASEFSSSLVHVSAPPAAIADILRVHEYEYIRRVLARVGDVSIEEDAAGDTTALDADTIVSRGSWKAALRAAGAVCAAVDAVVSGTASNAFCAVRPPGHHAGPSGIVRCERDSEGSHGCEYLIEIDYR